MKKAKILAVFGILLAMGITACNKGGENGGDDQSQETPATQQTSEGGASENTSSTHTHKWNAWAVVEGEEPTCTEPGTEKRTCKECDAFEEREKAALGHNFENGTEVPNSDTSTCTADGIKKIKCARCDATKDVEVKAHHKFGQRTKVDKGSGTNEIDYYTATCSVDSALELSFPTEVGGVYQGTTRKNNTPEGYTKLTGNGSISWTINLAGTKGYIGKMYHMACMDAFSSNSEKDYTYYATSGSNVTRTEGNFKFYVNGIEADKSAYMNISFDNLTKDGEVDPNLAAVTESPGPYSPVALCPLGDNVYIGPGTNVFKYERTGSYNMVMRELVFIGTEYTHAHNNSTEFTGKDENQHWKVCTAPGCPINGKIDAANHTFVEVLPADDTETDAAHKAKAATCSEEGIKVEVCSVCNYRKESKIEKLPHTLGEAYDIVAATCEAEGSQKKRCSVCDEVINEVLPKKPHTFGEIVENYAAGEGYIATTAHNCSVCGKSSLRWKATDYDVTKTTDRSTAGPESRGGGKAIRWSSTTNYSGGDATVKGCHIVYNVKLLEDVTNVGLAFETSMRDDIDTIFDKHEGDTAKGYEYVDGQLVRPASRYGLKVDGNVILIEKDNSGQVWKDGINWYTFPVTIPSLTAGIHEIELYNLGGYRADIYNFQLVGLSHVTSSHEHNGDDAWVTDGNNHWHACTAEDCPTGDGIYGKAEHTFGAKYDEVAATCSAKGSYKQKCTVCEYVATFETDKLEHEWVASEVTVVEGAKGTQTLTCSNCDEVKSFTGGIYGTFKWSEALQAGSSALDGAKFNKNATYNFVVLSVPADGVYTITLPMMGSSGNEAYTINGTGQGFGISANGVNGTILAANKTYAEVFGESQEAWVDIAFAEVTLKAGANEIKLTTNNGGYRVSVNVNTNMTIAPKAAA